MKTKTDHKAESYKNTEGKWVPSGNIVHKDSMIVVEVKKSFDEITKNSKKEADKYFVSNIDKEK